MEFFRISEANAKVYEGALKKRIEQCCCKYCGGELVLKNIIYGDKKDGRVEVYCSKCNRIEYGVEKEIYTIAKYFVDEMGFDYYSDLDECEQKRNMNVAKVCEIVSWGLENLGYLDGDGLKYPVDLANLVVGEDVIFDDDLLKRLKEI